MRRRYVGGGTGEFVLGDTELVLGTPQRLLQLDEAGVKPRQPPVHEAAQLQPRVDRGATVPVLTPAARRDGAQRPDLLDEAQLVVPAPSRRRVLLAQPLDPAPQPLGRRRTERLGLDLHPGLTDAHPVGAEDAGPQ